MAKPTGHLRHNSEIYAPPNISHIFPPDFWRAYTKCQLSRFFQFSIQSDLQCYESYIVDPSISNHRMVTTISAILIGNQSNNPTYGDYRCDLEVAYGTTPYTVIQSQWISAKVIGTLVV